MFRQHYEGAVSFILPINQDAGGHSRDKAIAVLTVYTTALGLQFFFEPFVEAKAAIDYRLATE